MKRSDLYFLVGSLLISSFPAKLMADPSSQNKNQWIEVMPDNPLQESFSIYGSINGLQPERFKIDTGASITVITQEAAHKSDLKCHSTLQGITAGGMVTMCYGIINTLSIGGITLYNQRVQYRAYENKAISNSQQSPDSFLLGMSALESLTLKIVNRRLFIKKM